MTISLKISWAVDVEILEHNLHIGYMFHNLVVRVNKMDCKDFEGTSRFWNFPPYLLQLILKIVKIFHCSQFHTSAAGLPVFVSSQEPLDLKEYCDLYSTINRAFVLEFYGILNVPKGHV